MMLTVAQQCLQEPAAQRVFANMWAQRSKTHIAFMHADPYVFML